MSKKQSTSFMDGLVHNFGKLLGNSATCAVYFFHVGSRTQKKKPLFDLFLEAKCQVHGLAWTIGQYVVSDVFEY